MDDFEKYYNDPDILDEPAPLREVHAIRLMQADETKDMTQEEKLDYYRKASEEAERKYRFKRIWSGNVNEKIK